MDSTGTEYRITLVIQTTAVFKQSSPFWLLCIKYVLLLTYVIIHYYTLLIQNTLSLFYVVNILSMMYFQWQAHTCYTSPVPLTQISADFPRIVAPLSLPWNWQGNKEDRWTENLLPHTFLWGNIRQVATPWSKRVALNSFAEWTSRVISPGKEIS